MFPPATRGVLLRVTDRGDETGGDDAVEQIEGVSVVTRKASTIESLEDVPAEAWIVVDADVLEETPPAWFDPRAGDVYVLATGSDAVPEWVRSADVPVLDPALVDLLAQVRRADTKAGADADTKAVADADTKADANPAVATRHVDLPETEAAPADNGREPTGGRLSDPLSVVPFAVALLDRDGVIRDLNDRWVDFGRENGCGVEETDIGVNYLDVCDADDDPFSATVANAIRRVLDGERTVEEVEYPCQGEGHSQQWYVMAVVAVEDDGPAAAAVIHHDVTQYKQRINVLDRVLRHNLRNKANIILGHAAALANERDDETATAATTIGAAARELLSLSEQARRYQEVSRGDRPTTPIDVAALTAEITERVSQRHPEAVVELSHPATAIVEGTQSLSLVVHELVENAIIHNDSAEPWVRVEVVRVHESGDERISVRVVDDGPGIPEEDRRLLTGGLEEHPIRHGSQLGVWVVSSLVTSLNGKVSVEPRTPRGSIVTVSFPSVSVEAE